MPSGAAIAFATDPLPNALSPVCTHVALSNSSLLVARFVVVDVILWSKRGSSTPAVRSVPVLSV